MVKTTEQVNCSPQTEMSDEDWNNATDVHNKLHGQTIHGPELNALLQNLHRELVETSNHLRETTNALNNCNKRKRNLQRKRDQCKGDLQDCDSDLKKCRNPDNSVTTERFANNESNVETKFLNLNVFLKAVLFVCLFYVLSHKNMHVHIYKNMFNRISYESGIYVSMVVFFVVYYLVSIYL